MLHLSNLETYALVETWISVESTQFNIHAHCMSLLACTNFHKIFTISIQRSLVSLYSRKKWVGSQTRRKSHNSKPWCLKVIRIEGLIIIFYINIRPVLDVYEKELATREYLAGPLSLADLFHLPNLSILFITPFFLPPLADYV